MDPNMARRVARLERASGRPVVVLVEWMLMNVEPRIRTAARDLGFTEDEAAAVARVTLAGMVKSLHSGVESVKLDRKFRQGS